MVFSAYLNSAIRMVRRSLAYKQMVFTFFSSEFLAVRVDKLHSVPRCFALGKQASIPRNHKLWIVIDSFVMLYLIKRVKRSGNSYLCTPDIGCFR